MKIILLQLLLLLLGVLFCHRTTEPAQIVEDKENG